MWVSLKFILLGQAAMCSVLGLASNGKNYVYGWTCVVHETLEKMFPKVPQLCRKGPSLYKINLT